MANDTENIGNLAAEDAGRSRRSERPDRTERKAGSSARSERRDARSETTRPRKSEQPKPSSGDGEKKERHGHSSTGRFKTGFIFSGSVLACTLIGDITTLIMVMVLAGFCTYELCALLRSDAKLPNEWIAVVAAVLYPPCYYWFGISGFLPLTIIVCIAALVWYVAYPRARITDVAGTVFSSLYTGMMLTSLVIVRMALPGIWGGLLATIVIFSVWTNDTMAYAWGSRLGRHRMAPRISPKKSWEGCVAGIIGSFAIWMFAPFIPGVTLTFVDAGVIGIVSGMLAVLGDLSESRIKRAAGKKDSGNALPGHGGFFDRCDALILGSAAAAVMLMLFGIVPM